MKNKKYIYSIIIPIVLVASLLTAKFIHFVNTPNTRLYIHDNVKAWAKLKNGKTIGYNIIEIGNVNSYLDSKTQNYIICIGDNIINTGIVDLELLKKLSNYTEDPNKYNKAWPTGAIRFYINGCAFIFADYKIISITLVSHNESGIGMNVGLKIGKPSSNYTYNFNLSDDQMLMLFGYPDKLRDYWKK